jgi:hypothetical protein
VLRNRTTFPQVVITPRIHHDQSDTDQTIRGTASSVTAAQQRAVDQESEAVSEQQKPP